MIRFVWLFVLPGVSGVALSQDDKTPDYSQNESWAALPQMKDAADTVPVPMFQDNQANAEVDVFFIHPTSHIFGLGWNADIDDKAVNKTTDEGSIRNQASAFNGSCKVYAPRYRQAVLRTFFIDNERSEEAMELAYSDVKRSFEYYLENYNNGRPFFIASHSQGTRHAVKLVSEMIDGKPLQEQVIAFYLVGFAVNCDTFKTIQPCDGPGDTGCMLAWNTFRWGAHNPRGGFYDGSCCINPLTWELSGGHAGKEEHEGSIPFTFDTLHVNVLDAKCVDGKLWMHPPEEDWQYAKVSLLRNYHVYDYNLFYADIRKNVALQVENFIKSKQ